ncbi:MULTISPECIES: LacI family DNA-binding transcriptional regulator [unclassified Clostridium]|uniref:LacI family DNA-binding transcriptional regulator n=1 Tax=Clostridium TaxID=1485 RepID=UPI001C8B3488|nr:MULTISPECIES: LacI family DNA-binding transcriptional regulator [unclassified Clostridium]MBX9136440.1 LacI family transcriptional regulator [Clostridium sp. K12(2020)]MBX9143079.1 LacI family transcriptional regulator [Clostridium sp. K13]MDU2291346.1 LacI family DNA-binding transcriptional regulator [Clostridium celatum]MDU4325107.1 LacI family DNA-binding transcriptional regulator [Clostridium celatum]
MATIVDVAKLAGVTPTTVSRVINNRGYISEKTRNKVYGAMDELGYQPNEIARSLTKQKSNTIGVIVPHISHPYFAKLISNLENEASKKDYKIILCNSKEKAEKEKQYLDMCKSNRVAGIVLCSGNVESNKINTGDIPVVLLEKNFEEGKLGIQCDNYQGGKLATEHLIECGCKKVLHFSGVIDEEMPADNREKAFIDTCIKNSVKYYIKKFDINTYNQMDYYEAIKDTIAEVKEIDGIFASSDLIAAQVIQVCNELNIRIPQDIKLVGFDDVEISKLTTPTITTIHQPIKEMSKLAVELIDTKYTNVEIDKQIIVPVELVVRNSTK